MRVKYEYAGTNPTPKGLLVYVEIVTGSTRRLTSVHVPWVELIDQTILHEIDRTVRAKLMAAWEGRDELQLGLPGID